MAKTVKHENLKSFWGSEDHLEVAQNRSFPALIFELLSDKIPTENQLVIFELVLSLSIDHGPDTPSAIKTIEAAKKKKSISESVSAGILQINDTHGGAITPAMELFYEIHQDRLKLVEVMDKMLKEGKKIAGFGHRLYAESDPRAGLILEYLEDLKMGGEFINIAQNIEHQLSVLKDKKLPLNIDGAIAVALCSFGWEPRLGKAVFLIARTPGLCAHYLNNS